MTATIPRSGIRSLLERYAGADVVNLASGDPYAATPERVLAAAHQAARDGHTHYTDVRGIAAVRDAVTAKLRGENGIPGVDADANVVLTAGAMNGLAVTLQAVLTPGDETILLDPSFPNYRAHVLLAGGTPVPVALRADTGFRPDEDTLRAALTPRTRAIVVNSPNNPTGAVYPRDTMHMLVRVAEQHDCWLVSDEAYEHTVFAPHRHVSPVALQPLPRNVIGVYTLSKSYAMTGWRAGYVVAPADVVESICRIQEHQLGSLNTPTQHAMLAALAGPPVLVDEYRARSAAVHTALADVDGVRVVAPGGTFYTFVDVGVPAAEAVRELAESSGVLVMPGDCFGAAGHDHIRVSCCGDGRVLDEGLARLRDGLQALSRTDERSRPT